MLSAHAAALTLKNSIAYSKPVPQVMVNDMKTIKPVWMCAVPRLWDAVAKNICKEVRKRGKFINFAFNLFLTPAKKYADFKDMIKGNVLQIKKRSRILDFVIGLIPFIILFPVKFIADIFLFSKIRKNLGGKIKIALSGGGSLQKEVNDFYRAISFNLLRAKSSTPTNLTRFCISLPSCKG